MSIWWFVCVIWKQNPILRRNNIVLTVKFHFAGELRGFAHCVFFGFVCRVLRIWGTLSENVCKQLRKTVNHLKNSLNIDQLDLLIYLEWFWFYLLFMLLFIYLLMLLYIYINALETLCYRVMLIKLIWIWKFEFERGRDRGRERERERGREREKERESERKRERGRGRERESERERESVRESARACVCVCVCVCGRGGGCCVEMGNVHYRRARFLLMYTLLKCGLHGNGGLSAL